MKVGEDGHVDIPELRRMSLTVAEDEGDAAELLVVSDGPGSRSSARRTEEVAETSNPSKSTDDRGGCR